MKRTKLLALALAGVMVLALLTGCSGGKTEDRRIAENIADIMKRSHPNVKEVSYSVPELSGAVRSAFAPGWLNEAGTVLERDALTKDGRTVKVFMEDSLKAYEERSTVYFFAFDATGESGYAQSERLCPVGAVRAGESPVAHGLLSEGVDYGLHKNARRGLP